MPDSKRYPANRVRFGEPSDIVAQLSKLIALYRQYRSMTVGQASGLSNFIEVVLRFAGLQYVHRLEAYATFHAR